MHRIGILMLVVCLLSCGRSGFAQQIIQQPVVQRFSTDTVVSVPDRGSAHLGGVGSAGAARREYGPLPWGTAGGQFASSSSLDASVYIHDFEALDAAVLAQPIRERHPTTIRSPRAAAALRSLKRDWRRD